MATHLVIPDSHAKPDIPNDRFDWLGQLIMDVRPDAIIELGDLADMPSLSSYDRGKKSYEGRRYIHDIDTANDALARIVAPMDDFNRRAAASKHRQYKPRMVKLWGNHEQRIVRATELSPELDGLIGLRDINTSGWETYPYLSPVEIDGVHYAHYFISGVMGNPISGEYPAGNILKKQYVSCVAGHLHVRDFTQRTRADGRHICGLVAGCFFDHREAYAGMANDLWWRGVVILHDVADGYFNPEFIGIDTLRNVYA